MQMCEIVQDQGVIRNSTFSWIYVPLQLGDNQAQINLAHNH